MVLRYLWYLLFVPRKTFPSYECYQCYIEEQDKWIFCNYYNEERALPMTKRELEKIESVKTCKSR